MCVFHYLLTRSQVGTYAYMFVNCQNMEEDGFACVCVARADLPRRHTHTHTTHSNPGGLHDLHVLAHMRARGVWEAAFSD